jgi:hypothetical protein
MDIQDTCQGTIRSTTSTQTVTFETCKKGNAQGWSIENNIWTVNSSTLTFFSPNVENKNNNYPQVTLIFNPGENTIKRNGGFIYSYSDAGNVNGMGTIRVTNVCNGTTGTDPVNLTIVWTYYAYDVSYDITINNLRIINNVTATFVQQTSLNCNFKSDAYGNSRSNKVSHVTDTAGNNLSKLSKRAKNNRNNKVYSHNLYETFDEIAADANKKYNFHNKK